MTQEKKVWLEETANVLEHLVSKYRYSSEIVACKPGNLYFEDSRNYIDLIDNLQWYADTMRGCIKFNDLGETKPAKK